MYNIETTATFEKQFKTLNKRASSGKLNKNNLKFLKKYSHCILHMIEKQKESILYRIINFSISTHVKVII